MPLAPFARRWRLLAVLCLLAAAVASPVSAQGERNPVMYILMGDHYFLPASVTVRPRTTVVWINESASVHRVRSALWDSGPLLPGQAFWRTFDVPGEYWFTDPTFSAAGMNGYITVQAGETVATRTPVRPPATPTPTRPPASPTPAATPAPAATPRALVPAEVPAALPAPPAPVEADGPADSSAAVAGPEAPVEVDGPADAPAALPVPEARDLPLLGKLAV
jgi:plastocyanin